MPRRQEYHHKIREAGRKAYKTVYDAEMQKDSVKAKERAIKARLAAEHLADMKLHQRKALKISAALRGISEKEELRRILQLAKKNKIGIREQLTLIMIGQMFTQNPHLRERLFENTQVITRKWDKMDSKKRKNRESMVWVGEVMRELKQEIVQKRIQITSKKDLLQEIERIKEQKEMEHWPAGSFEKWKSEKK